MVIVDENVARGVKAGRHMADNLRRDFREFEMHVHVRQPTTLTTDDAYAKYTAP